MATSLPGLQGQWGLAFFSFSFSFFKWVLTPESRKLNHIKPVLVWYWFFYKAFGILCMHVIRVLKWLLKTLSAGQRKVGVMLDVFSPARVSFLQHHFWEVGGVWPIYVQLGLSKHMSGNRSLLPAFLYFQPYFPQDCPTVYSLSKIKSRQFTSLPWSCLPLSLRSVSALILTLCPAAVCAC